MIPFCIAITVLILWNVGLTVALVRILRDHRILVKGQNSLAVSVFRLVMVLSGQTLTEDDSEDTPDNVDDLLGGDKS